MINEKISLRFFIMKEFPFHEIISTVPGALRAGQGVYSGDTIQGISEAQYASLVQPSQSWRRSLLFRTLRIRVSHIAPGICAVSFIRITMLTYLTPLNYCTFIFWALFHWFSYNFFKKNIKNTFDDKNMQHANLVQPSPSSYYSPNPSGSSRCMRNLSVFHPGVFLKCFELPSILHIVRPSVVLLHPVQPPQA